MLQTSPSRSHFCVTSDFLREKTEERGPDALINANDIADFVSKMKNRGQKPS